jgi:hypothetical protein
MNMKKELELSGNHLVELNFTEMTNIDGGLFGIKLGFDEGVFIGIITAIALLALL